MRVDRKHAQRSALLAAAVLGISSVVSSTALGADRTWDGFTSNQWTLPGNWTAVAEPGPTDNARFRNQAGINNSLVNLNANRIIAEMSIDGTPSVGAYEFQKTGNALLTVTGPTRIGLGGLGASPVTFNGFRLTTGSITFAGTSTLTGGAQLTTTTGAVLAQGSALHVSNSTVTGPAVSSRLGGSININSGGIVTGTTTIGEATSRININSGGILNATGASFFNGTLTLNGGGTINLTGNLDTAGPAFIQFNRDYSLPAGRTMTIAAGGRLVGTEFMDIAAAAGPGSLVVDGAGSSVQLGTSPLASWSDWGNGNAATVTLSNGGTASFLRGLQIATAGTSTTARVSINTGASLTVENFLNTGGGNNSASITINNGTLTSNGPTQFLANSTVALESGGRLAFGGDATFSTGSTLNWSGGTMTVGISKTLTIDGGVGTISQGVGFSGAAALRVENGGLLRANQWLDIGNSDTGGSTGSLTVSGPGSRVIAGGGGGDWTDWGRNTGDNANIVFTGGGVGTYNSGIRIANNGGAANVQIQPSGQLNTASLLVGGTGSSQSVITVIGGELHVLGPATFNTGSAIYLDLNPNFAATGISILRIDGNATYKGNSALAALAGSINIGGTLATTDTARVYREITGGGQRVTRVGGLSITGSSVVDIADSHMIVGPATPKSTIQSYIVTGRSGGTWNQLGLTSLAARNNPAHNTTLGILSGAEFTSVGGGGLFFGQSYLATDTLVRYTLYGDTDLNGVVDFDDYSRIDAGFNNNRTGWFNGDVDYNGIVDFDDYSLIDQAFNTQGGDDGLLRAIHFLDGSDRDTRDMTRPELGMVLKHFNQFGQPYANAFLAAVPEPATALSVAALGGLIAGRRNRRKL